MYKRYQKFKLSLLLIKAKRFRSKKPRIIFTLTLCIIFCLSTLSINFVEAATKTSYVMQNKKVEWKEGDIVRGIVSFQYPRFKGNSKEIKKINKVLENAMKAYMADENVESIKETTLELIENKVFSDDTQQLYWKTTCKITYNENSIVSMHMKEMWYAWGVYNQKDYGYTFNLKTGKTMTAVDVVGVKSEEVKNKVLACAKTYFDIDNTEGNLDLWDDVSNIINKYDVKEFKFYLVPGKTCICFESYALNCGPSWQIFSIPSKYK